MSLLLIVHIISACSAILFTALLYSLHTRRYSKITEAAYLVTLGSGVALILIGNVPIAECIMGSVIAIIMYGAYRIGYRILSSSVQI